MNRRERALNALDFKEPDIVPIWELSIDGPHIETLTGMKWIGTAKETNLDRRSIERHNIEAKVLCYNKLESAMIIGAPSSPDGWMPKTFLNGAYVDEWGRIRVYDPRAKNYFVTRGVINTPEDFENFVTPNPYASGVLSAFEYLVKLARGEMAIAAEVRAPFATAWEMFGVQNFCQWLHERPGFIRKAIERITNYNIELIKVMADAGADVIVSNGDIAEKNGPMVPPKFFKEMIFPNMKKEVNAAHKMNIKFIKHSDGDLNLLLDDLSSTVDGLHSLDPSAGMDIGKIKERYGDHLILMGNVSVDKLALSTREEIISDTRECVKRAAPGGGYFLSSSNSWYFNTRLENCLAMVESGKKFGRYPISL